LSARWRRSNKRSKRSDIFKVFNRAKEKDTPQMFRIKNSRVKRRTYPYRHRLPKTYKERKWRDPEPLVDILEEENEIIIIAEFAGFRKENLRIHVRNQQLILSAEALDRKYHKSLNLPRRVIPSNIQTTYKNGVLEVRLKKAIEEKPIDKVAG